MHRKRRRSSISIKYRRILVILAFLMLFSFAGCTKSEAGTVPGQGSAVTDSGKGDGGKTADGSAVTDTGSESAGAVTDSGKGDGGKTADGSAVTDTGSESADAVTDAGKESADAVTDAGQEDGGKTADGSAVTDAGQESTDAVTDAGQESADAVTDAGQENAGTPAYSSAVTDPGDSSNAKTGSYTAPEPHVSAFHEDKARGENGALIDLSAASEGYVGVKAASSGKLKFQVLKGESTYTYDLKSDGTPSIFPLQMGDGDYSFRVLENISGTKYAVMYSTDETISIADEFVPYLCSSDYVAYTDDSACVKKAKELAGSAADANSLISAVYDYVCKSVKYDKQKAQTVQSGYLPVPDETLSTGKGICFDYASLAAAMLRSQGIPCKVIFGYVSPNEVYHAWNMFYTEENGWVTAKFEISGKAWNRMDLTFSANGADSTFIGDGSNYKEVYCY